MSETTNTTSPESQDVLNSMRVTALMCEQTQLDETYPTVNAALQMVADHYEDDTTLYTNE